jgi:hypothetical protein
MYLKQVLYLIVHCKRSSQLTLCTLGMTNPSDRIDLGMIGIYGSINDRFPFVSEPCHYCGKYNNFKPVTIFRRGRQAQLTARERSYEFYAWLLSQDAAGAGLTIPHISHRACAVHKIS